MGIKRNRGAPYLIDVTQLMAELHVGRKLATRIAREHGRRLGKKLVILRSDLATFLVERDDGGGR